jgi:hypothetical protein
MLFALVLTLYVVPALYSFLSLRRKDINRDMQMAVDEMKHSNE